MALGEGALTAADLESTLFRLGQTQRTEALHAAGVPPPPYDLAAAEVELAEAAQTWTDASMAAAQAGEQRREPASPPAAGQPPATPLPAQQPARQGLSIAALMGVSPSPRAETQPQPPASPPPPQQRAPSPKARTASPSARAEPVTAQGQTASEQAPQLSPVAEAAASATAGPKVQLRGGGGFATTAGHGGAPGRRPMRESNHWVG